MSIGGMMRTSVSGMAAQSSRLGTVADNIANASTAGYKAAGTQFSTLLVDGGAGTRLSGGVEAVTREAIARQGLIERTDSEFDLAISGGGFLLVEDRDGTVALTRAGAFRPDGKGELVNVGGYRLLGLPVSGTAQGAVAVNGTTGLVPVDVGGTGLEATATTRGAFAANLPASSATVAAGDLPSLNLASSVSSARSSMVVYGNLGEEVTLDLHFAHTATPGEWELVVFDAAGRSTAGGVPYATGPLGSVRVQFDPDGRLDLTGPSTLAFTVPGGAAMALDLSGMTQLATDFAAFSVEADGSAPVPPSAFEIDVDGILYETYSDGSRRATWRIPLANVMSPDGLAPRAGNAYLPTGGSGSILVGAAGTGGLGSVMTGALEASTVDLASELTDMVEAQRNYTANSRVFQTGSELMDVLVNLKR